MWGQVFTNMFGDAIGEGGEINVSELFSNIGNILADPKGAKADLFKNILGTVYSLITGTNDALDETSKKDTKVNVDYSEAEAAISMADTLKKKYTLDENETLIASAGIKNLQNGVKVTEQQANVLQKVWDGCMIGLYESGEDRINALKKLFDLDSFDWEVFSNLLDENGHFDISKQTSAARDQANAVKQMIELGESYTNKDLMNDIYAGKWGYDDDRIKALEEAGYDAEKVQEQFLKWYNGDKSVENLGDDYLRISEAEKTAAKQAEKMNAVLNQTPEGAFRSVAEGLRQKLGGRKRSP